LTGLDASAGMVARATEKHSGVAFVSGDAMALPFSESSFDVVTARHMLYHVPNVETALLEAKRVLKPGGRFLALTNADGYMREFWEAVKNALEDDSVFTGLLWEHSQPKYFHGGLERQVRAAFNDVKLTVVDQWLEFPDPGPVLVYWDSIRAGEVVTDEDWARGRAKLREVLETRFHDGVWRVWKGIAFLEAQ
jgi:SAM-dependent methyltransferase